MFERTSHSIMHCKELYECEKNFVKNTEYEIVYDSLLISSC